ncbi:MAG TPA: helix-turn-helix domain-containing protein [Streptosporangiaceae bacterium]|nr:helix-turn-helix domain-containing protein [Streptosporangiaceae bacterium]
MYSRTTVDLAQQLSDIGVLDRENAQICGVSVRSIRHWRKGDRRPIGGSSRTEAPNCPRCHGRPLDEPAYSYLLGLYLGDGHIVKTPRTHLLSLACADCWPGLLQEAVQAAKRVMPSSSVSLRSRPGIACTYVQSFSKHWPCLFPQHGSGKKHERKIELEPWQQSIVDGRAGDFARGLFHSDGYRGSNRVCRHRPNGDRWYEYPRYLFTNHSADILRLCGEALDMLHVEWCFSKPTVISVARRDAVARLDEFVGPKY